MAQRDIVALTPLREAHIGPTSIGFGDDGVNKLITRVDRFALSIESVSPVSMGRLAVRIDGHSFSEPTTGGVEMLSAKLLVGGVKSLFEFGVTGVKRRVIKIRIRVQRPFVSRDRRIHVAFDKRCFALANRGFRSLDTGKWNQARIGR